MKFQEVGVDIEKHFHDCLQLSEIGKKTSLGLHLNYKFNNISNQAIVLEHDYCTKYQTNFDSNPGNRSSEAPKLPNNQSSDLPSVSEKETSKMKTLINFVPDITNIKSQTESQWNARDQIFSVIPKQST